MFKISVGMVIWTCGARLVCDGRSTAGRLLNPRGEAGREKRKRRGRKKMSEKAAGVAAKTPSDFLKAIRGRPVVVKLNSGVDYRGSSSSTSFFIYFFLSIVYYLLQLFFHRWSANEKFWILLLPLIYFILFRICACLFIFLGAWLISDTE